MHQAHTVSVTTFYPQTILIFMKTRSRRGMPESTRFRNLADIFIQERQGKLSKYQINAYRLTIFSTRMSIFNHA
jgi:hypothetical protein